MGATLIPGAPEDFAPGIPKQPSAAKEFKRNPIYIYIDIDMYMYIYIYIYPQIVVQNARPLLHGVRREMAAEASTATTVTTEASIVITVIHNMHGRKRGYVRGPASGI